MYDTEMLEKAYAFIEEDVMRLFDEGVLEASTSISIELLISDVQYLHNALHGRSTGYPVTTFQLPTIRSL